jgi:hypothetical protein
LSSSSEYNPIYHVAWRQPVHNSPTGFKIQINAGQVYSSGSTTPAAPANTSPTVPAGGDEQPMINEGDSPAQPAKAPTPASTGNKYALSGTIEISRGHYLHLDADLFYRKPGKSAGEAASSLKLYRLKHKRRMKSKEIHYIDNPMFGMLVYIKPI